MQASLFYRIAAVLRLLFAVGHTLGFRQSDPKWGVDAVVGSMRSLGWLSSSRQQFQRAQPIRLRPLFAFFRQRMPLAFSVLWPGFTLQGQSLCRGLGAGSPATQGIALRYS